MKTKIIIITALIISSCLINCSCVSKASIFEKVEIPGLENNRKFITSLCYTNENELIFSKGSRKEVIEGPYIDTDSIIRYDLKEKKITDKFKINKENYICNIVPYNEGVVYSSYELKENTDTYEWKISYLDKKEKKLLDKGICTSYDRIPQPILIKEVPLYLFEDIAAENETIKHYSCGVKQISGMQAEIIMQADDFSLLETTLATNGKEYCFLAIRHQKPYCYIGDLEGIKHNFDIGGRIGSFAINKDYAAISIETGQMDSAEGVYSLVTFDLKNGRTEKYATEEFLYRLKGGPGKHCLCVDWTFAPYEVTLKNGRLRELSMPEKFSIEPAISFYPLNENTYLAQFLLEGDDIAYYTVQME